MSPGAYAGGMTSEEAAAGLLRRLSVTEPIGSIEIAWRYWGKGRIHRVSSAEVWSESELTDEGILVLGSMPLERQNHAIASRLIEHWTRSIGVSVDLERAGAALLMPPVTFDDWLDRSSCVADVADAFRVQQTSAHLRLGEVYGAGVAVVAPTHVRTSGARLPAPPRALALADIRPRAIRKTTITDQPDRVALFAA